MHPHLFQIAQFIRHRSNRLSIAVGLYEARDALGEAYATAIQEGFLMPNLEDGQLKVTSNASKQALLRAAYEDESHLEAGDEVVVGNHPAVVIEQKDDGTYEVQSASKEVPSSLTRDQMKLTNRPKAASKGKGKKDTVFWRADHSDDTVYNWGQQ